ncbi:MAG: glucose-6-phosphate isomerase family protein [Candidatus Hodarchaeales archaeon]
MIDLTNNAGLSIILKNEKELDLQIGRNIKIDKYKVRKLGDMKDVLLDKIEIPEETIVYKMYDGVYKEENKELFKRKKLRYDLTLIFPGKVGREFIKTTGHYHSISDDRLFTYPELYEVLYGKVHFILQKKGKKENEIEDLVVIIAEIGQRIVVPPNYGHVAINPSSEPLVLANWIAEDCKPDYPAISRYGGASLFEIEEKGEIQLMVNEKYEFGLKYRTIKVTPVLSSLFGLNNNFSLYELLLEDPDSLNWLRYPSTEINRFGEYIGKEIKV